MATPQAVTGPTMLTAPTAIAANMRPSAPTATTPAATLQAASAPWNPGAPLSSATGTTTAQPASIESDSTTGTRTVRLATPPT